MQLAQNNRPRQTLAALLRWFIGKDNKCVLQELKATNALPFGELWRPLLAYAKLGEDTTQKVIARDFPGDLAKRFLGHPQLFGENFARLMID